MEEYLIEVLNSDNITANNNISILSVIYFHDNKI